MATMVQQALSTSEWRAVTIALNDTAAAGCASGGRPGLLGRLYSAITGNVPRRPLADGRLETIRRYVCAARRCPGVAERMRPELEAHGFTVAQVEALTLLSR